MDCGFKFGMWCELGWEDLWWGVGLMTVFACSGVWVRGDFEFGVGFLLACCALCVLVD